MVEAERAQLADYIAQKESEMGLQPGELSALWAQESNKSTNTKLAGLQLSKGRGAAIGPFQVVPYYHSDFPVDGDFKEQADYAAKLYAGGGSDPRARLAKYYGTGTAPAGQPTTAQYIKQTLGRMPPIGATKMEPTNMQAPVTLQQATQGDNVAGALQSYLLSQVRAPEQQQAQGQTRANSLAEYQDTLRAPAYGNYTPIDQGFYSMLGAMNPGSQPGYAALQGIAAGGEAMAKMNQSQHLGDVAAAKVGYDDTLSQDKLDAGTLAILARAGTKNGSSGKIITRTDGDGNIYLINNVTGEREVIPSTHAGAWSKAHDAGYTACMAKGDKGADCESYAVQYAASVVQSRPGSVTPNDAVQKPTVPVGSGKSAPTARVDPAIQDLYTQLDTLVATLPPGEDRDQALMYQAELKQKQRAGSITAPTTVEAASGAPKFERKDLRAEEFDKATGGEQGKSMEKERGSYSELTSQNYKLLNTLDMLEKIYTTKKIPEGELGPFIKRLRSGAQSLGFELKDVGDADLAGALSGRLALESRVAGGTNLLPGAMSDYEDKLLQSLSPGLSMTQDGRLKLIMIQRAMAHSHLRMADEASKWASDHGDALTPGWSSRKNELAKIEMAKIKEATDRTIGGDSTNGLPSGKTITREVKLKDGRIGVEYSDGSRGYK